MKNNPYIAGNPVGGGEAFIGRADVLRDVLRVLNNPQESGVVLYGQRRIGKTSVLLELAANLPKQGNFVPVYFDLQDKAAKPLEEVLQELAIRISLGINPQTESKSSAEVCQRQMKPANNGESVHEGASASLISQPGGLAPGETAESPPGRGRGGFPEDFQHTFLPNILSELPENTALVLLFDEFDVMDTSGNQAGSAFFPYLRELMTLNPQRLKFLFVIGRRPEDLSSLTLSVFKGIKPLHVSLLLPEDTAELARLSEKNQTLNWPDAAIKHVHSTTGGHPFLTQQLCQVVWENAYDDDPAEPPEVSEADIEQALPEALKNASNALEWLWDGLKPAQRVVASALAEAGSGVITQDQLEECLQTSGVRILIGELQDAPNTLEEWDLIRTRDGGYCFPSDMLRRWIVERKPLARVQDEIDRIQPVANNLFQAGYGMYQSGQLESAIPLLKQAIGLNPNHLKANQLLAEIYLAEGNLDEAVTLLETLYDYQPAVAGPRLLQAWMTKAQATSAETEKLALYEKILNIEPQNQEILTEYQTIWERRGDRAYKKERFKEALSAYQKANITKKIARIKKCIQIEECYTTALGHLEQDEGKKAQKLLVKVLAFDPAFKEAARYMYAAVTGVDPNDRIQTLEQRILELEAQRIEVVENQANKAQPSDDNPEWPLPLETFEFETVTVNIKGDVVERTPGKARQFVEKLGNDVTLEMVAIPGDTFLMGQSEDEKKYLLKRFGKGSYKDYFARELPQHKVTVPSFLIGKYPVTQAQWTAIMGENPSHFKDDKRPVEMVSWDDAVKFCQQVSEKTRYNYRLPSEAEWEYACRARTTTPFYFGETLTSELANYDGNSTYGSEPKGQYREQTSDVGIFLPNAFGLYDMHGNVWEWCQDTWHNNYSGAPTDGSAWETGDGQYRVLRGGSWSFYARDVRSTNRNSGDPAVRNYGIGFRLVKTV